MDPFSQPGFASPNSMFLQRQPQPAAAPMDPAFYGMPAAMPMPMPMPAAAPGAMLPPAPAAAMPAAPPLSPVTGLPQSAFGQAMRDGRANGLGVRQILAEFNPGMYGRYNPQPAAPATVNGLPPELAAMLGMVPAPVEEPRNSPSVPGGAALAPPPDPNAPTPRPGLERIAGRFPRLAARMGYQPPVPVPPRRGR